MSRVSERISSWLEDKLNNSENGIILDDPQSNSFEILQNFLEANDHLFQTPAIYYSAFAEESTAEFMSILEEELRAKLGGCRTKSCLTLPEIIKTAGLRLVIIDQSYLHPFGTTYELSKWLSKYHVGLVLVGSQPEMKESRIINHPAFCNWERLVVNLNRYDKLPISC